MASSHARFERVARELRDPGEGRSGPSGRRRSTTLRRPARLTVLGSVGAVVAALLLQPSLAANAASAPVEAGFTITAGDLSFILKQINIAERHAATATPAEPCKGLLNQPGDGIPDAEQVPDVLTSYGLRTVGGECNNLVPGREKFAAADVPFERMAPADFKDAENVPAGFPGAGTPTTYNTKQPGNMVFDTQPRLISNLIVDQTATNPAAVAAAGHPVRSQGNTGVFPCDANNLPAGCTPAGETLSIPNITTDVGLSPPFNGLFTIFGQFFDHGVDQTVKGGGTVFVPLRDDDPLVAGPDHIFGNADDLDPNLRFMVLTRGQNEPGPDGVLGTADDLDPANTDTPLVDQSQTYTSHGSHQAFLREYELDAANHPKDTGRLLGGPSIANGLATNDLRKNGMSTWATTKDQAARVLGLKLRDVDVLDIPMLATDPYGNFVPGPDRGLPQYVTATGLVEGDLASPVEPPANVLHFHTPFLTDIAHDADPGSVGPCTAPNTPSGCKSPDPDTTAGTQLDGQAAGTYDDELLDSHFTAGDGRVNENIALTTVHQIFHSEHDRLIGDINNTLTTKVPQSVLQQWTRTDGPSGWNYGQRLFQAARFVTEMEYQHLVFEEFARKVQPAIDPFHVYHSDVNPTIPAEFAAAVYRFGHSMLTETIDRTAPLPAGSTSPPQHYDIKLLDGFLNPPEYNRGLNGSALSSEAAAGGIIMGMSDQVGQEIDEFVTDTLRNNLLGLPLDLPTLNMTRARSEGIPTLNNLRRQIFSVTNDGQLAPYTSWADLGNNLKHPESLVNFVAAYGTYPSIVNATTYQAKRAAAQAIIDPGVGLSPTQDEMDFINGAGAWANQETGLNKVDLWVGGLAESTDINGGLLGKTFNYVFETSLTNLQNGDRLYYLARTPGMNLRTQLESNSFAELIMRNTDNTHTLKQDAFATADCKFQLANLANTAAGFTQFGASVTDDPTTDCDENALLTRSANGQITYKLINSVDPAGINGQSVYNGDLTSNRIKGGIDNDTILGNDGNDWLDGNSGDDVVIGGDGADRMTDTGGADVLKGGPGNDAMDAGNGIDIMMGGDGRDFMNGGANDNEEFAGPDDDFIIAGAGTDTAFGGGGDDWIQGGSGQDLLIGDHGAPFFDDPAETSPGHDIFIGQVGENDYDTEGGDDIMSQNSFVDRNAGAGGFDWAIHQYDTVAADDDMAINNNLGPLPIQVVVNRDRWQETEADSGSARNDVIRGNDDVPSAIGGAGFTGCDVLDQAGVNRISGLSAILPPLTGALAPVVANSAAGTCPLSGPIWGDGNILLGGGGSDTITGRGADDIIDGDRSLQVRISVRTNADGTGPEIGSATLMEGTYQAGNPKTLQQAVFDGTVDPGQLVMVREIVPAPAGDTGVDTAVFLAPRASFTVVRNANGSFTVTQTGAVNRATQKVSDGIDTLRNIERLQFTDQVLLLTPPPAPTNVAATTTPSAAATGSATVTWTAPVLPAGTSPITSYDIVVSSNGVVTQTITGIARTAVSRVVTGLVTNRPYTFQVRANNLFGAGPLSAPSNAVTPVGVPSAPTAVTAVRGNTSVSLSWTPGSDGGSPVTGWLVQVRIGGTTVRTDTVSGSTPSALVSGLTNGTAYNFRVQAVNANGTGAASASSNTVTPATVPGKPGIGTPIAGVAGGASNAQAVWSAPASNGGSTITNYRVNAYRVAADGVTLTFFSQTTFNGTVTPRTIALPTGNYQFEVVAINALGDSVPSDKSTTVVAR
ncbi:peroxidase family protein [Phycicoccus sp. Root101]|uniref:peroxidase family protein n=1 Tax=Phycicoccus sp. Root101 TaxID=1736421 RepID=UPI0009EAA6F9|nr:peroxidase family protein [Phycicoccus sp. Root101]